MNTTSSLPELMSPNSLPDATASAGLPSATVDPAAVEAGDHFARLIRQQMGSAETPGETPVTPVQELGDPFARLMLQQDVPVEQPTQAPALEAGDRFARLMLQQNVPSERLATSAQESLSGVDSDAEAAMDGNLLPIEAVDGLPVPLEITAALQPDGQTVAAMAAEHPVSGFMRQLDGHGRGAGPGSSAATLLEQATAASTAKNPIAATEQKAPMGPVVSDILAAAINPLQPQGVDETSIPLPERSIDSAVLQQTIAAQSLHGQAQVLQPPATASSADLGIAMSAAGPGQTAGTQHSNLISAPDLDLPLGQSGWDRELSSRVQWMVNRDVQTAELRINPPNLGPVELRVSVQNDQASVILVSQHAVVREAMEAALPRLRDMLTDQGMQQVEVAVSNQSFAEQRQSGGQQTADGEVSVLTEVSSEASAEAEDGFTTGMNQSQGRVDFYA